MCIRDSHSLAVLDSLKAVHRADSAAAFAALPAWKKAQILAGADTSQATAAATEETGHFVIDAGSFLFEDAAEKAASALRGATKVPVKIDSSTAGEFHV